MKSSNMQYMQCLKLVEHQTKNIVSINQIFEALNYCWYIQTLDIVPKNDHHILNNYLVSSEYLDVSFSSSNLC